MSAQRLSEKNVARWGSRLGLPIRRMWSHGGYRFGFVTDDHRHGSVHKISGEIEWDDNPIHYTSCDEMFPAEKATSNS